MLSRRRFLPVLLSLLTGPSFVDAGFRVGLRIGGIRRGCDVHLLSLDRPLVAHREDLTGHRRLSSNVCRPDVLC